MLFNGSVVDANLTAHGDLFWALKGGGPNFGIVTQYDLATKPIRTIWFQANVYSVNQTSEVLNAFANWQRNSSQGLRGNLNFVLGIDRSTALLFYSEAADSPETFQLFYEIEPLEVAAVPSTNSTTGTLTTILGSLASTQPRR